MNPFSHLNFFSFQNIKIYYCASTAKIKDLGLLAFVQGQKGHTSYFNNLKADSMNITYSMTLLTKSSNQNFIVFLNKIQEPSLGTKDVIFLLFLMSCPLTHFLTAEFGCLANSLGMSGTSKRIGLKSCAQVGFLLLFIMPFLVPSVAAELPGSTETTTLAHLADTKGPRKKCHLNFNNIFLSLIIPLL